LHRGWVSPKIRSEKLEQIVGQYERRVLPKKSALEAAFEENCRQQRHCERQTTMWAVPLHERASPS
jgi:hypothetical protein